MDIDTVHSVLEQTQKPGRLRIDQHAGPPGNLLSIQFPQVHSILNSELGTVVKPEMNIVNAEVDCIQRHGFEK